MGENIQRITGRRLQERRRAAWIKADGCCQRCGRSVAFNALEDEGFELDHIVPLLKGGEDEPHNLQVLCIPDCHDRKTAEDLGVPYRPRMQAGPDGWPQPVSHRPMRQRARTGP